MTPHRTLRPHRRRAGIIAIAGTGSIALGGTKRAKSRERVAGLRVRDEGGGFDITTVQALRATCDPKRAGATEDANGPSVGRHRSLNMNDCYNQFYTAEFPNHVLRL